MDDDQSFSERPGPVFLSDEESRKRSPLRACLFLGISLILIASLVGTSLLAYFVIVRRETAPATEHASAAATTGPSRSEIGSTASGLPTAAPGTLVAALSTTSPDDPAAPQSNSGIDRIVIVNSEGQVETLSPSGEERRVLTADIDNVFFQFPTWAPDGSRIAVIGSRFSGGGVYVFEDLSTPAPAGESQVYFSADETPFYLYWSPDSEQLAFLANHGRDTMGLNVISGENPTESRLLATGSPFYWDWTADGHQLLIHSGQGRASDTLAMIDVQGQTRADNLATPGVFQAPGIAHSDRYWAFAEETAEGLSSLVVVDAQSGERRSYEEVGSLAFSWSPTQNRLAYTHGRVEGHPFWGPLQLLDVESGETRLLTSQSVLAFFWSPDGRSIAFITLGRDDEGGVNVSAPGSLRRVSFPATTTQQQGQGLLTLSIVDVESGHGLRLLDFEPTNVYVTQFLPFFDQYALSHRVWAPDSSALVLPVREGDGDVILVVSATGGRPYRLAQGDIAFWSHR